MKVSTLNKNKYLYISIGILILFIVWLISSSIVNNELVIPSISKVFLALKDLFSVPLTYIIISFTIIRVLIALVLGFLLGIVFGVLSFIYKPLYYILSPLIKIMRVLPIASIILILLIMFGQKGYNDFTLAPIIMGMLLIIPIVFEAVYRSILSLDKDLIDVGRLDASNNFELIIHSYIPLIKDNIITAVYQSIGLGIKVMVMAEYISQTQTSIGKSLLEAKSYLEYDYVFAWTIILIIVCLLIEGTIVLLEHFRLKKKER